MVRRGLTPRSSRLAFDKRLKANVRCRLRSLGFIVVALLVAAKADACGCSQQTSARHPHVDKYATVIFVGEVTAVSPPDSNGVVLIDFRVVEPRRGVRGEFVTIEVHNGGTSCDLQKASFQVGERYLMSGTGIELAGSAPEEAKRELVKRPRYFNNYCGLRERLAATPNTSPERTRER